MTTYVLVPGFWLGGWAWDAVARRLEGAGHRAFPVTLTGLADRVDEASSEVGLDTHIADIERLIRDEDLRDVVLIGHSGGGIPVTAIADRLPDRLARVVYVDSGPLPDGMAQIDFNPPEARAAVERQVAAEGDGWRIPPPSFDPTGDPVNLAGLSEADIALLRKHATPQPVRTATDALRLGGPASVPMTIIACTMSADAVRALVGPVDDVRELPTGHWPMFSRPGGLADILLTLGG